MPRTRSSRRTTVPWVDAEQALGSIFARAGYRAEAVMPDRYFAHTMLFYGFIALTISTFSSLSATAPVVLRTVRR